MCIRAAHLLRELLDSLDLRSYVKTSGADGIHVLVPITRRYGFDETYAFAEAVARRLEEDNPGVVTTEWLKRKREGVLLDHRQNGHGKTLASVYSVRPKPGAPVSTPLRWEELTEDVTPRTSRWTVALERIERHGDLFEPTLRAAANRSAAPGPDLEVVDLGAGLTGSRGQRARRPRCSVTASERDRGGDRRRDAAGVLGRLRARRPESVGERECREVEPRRVRVRLGAVTSGGPPCASSTPRWPTSGSEAGTEAGRRDRRSRRRAASRPPARRRRRPVARRPPRSRRGPSRTASTKPTSRIGTVPVRANCAIPSAGAGRPYGSRSGIEILRSAWLTGSDDTRRGSRPIAMPSSWLGTPSVSRRTTIGGVRTLSRTAERRLDEVDGDLGAEFPEPTTSTSSPANGVGSTYSAEWIRRPVNVSARPIGQTRALS